MKILQVSNGFPPTARAGVEQYTYRLAQSLQGRGHEVAVICREEDPRRPDYGVIQDRAGDVTVYRVVNSLLDVVAFDDYYRNATIEQVFLKLVDREQPDIVHFQHTIGLSVTLLGITARLGMPLVLSLHDYWYICPTVQLLNTQMQICPGAHHGADCTACLGQADRLARRLHRYPVYRRIKAAVPPRAWARVQQAALAALSLAGGRRATGTTGQDAAGVQRRVATMQDMLSQCQYFIAPSACVRDVYTDFGIPAGRIDVLPLGLDLGPWQNRPPARASSEDVVRFVYIGTLLPHKGVDILISALRQVAAPNMRLSIYGYGRPDDPYQEVLRRLAGRDRRICFMGGYDNQQLPVILANEDVLVIPSRWKETYSLVAREAMLARKPIIASEVGALPEVVQAGQNGVLVPPGDVGALARAMAELADNPGQRQALRDGARPEVPSIAEHADQVLARCTAVQRMQLLPKA